ncbi:MAG TPA: hypothetical protein PLQ13_01865 [Candidatus Krumholzibacteria bacterium]|nr:hypothetical protein [Candidatus Krumholzibacteria bacterium]
MRHDRLNRLLDAWHEGGPVDTGRRADLEAGLLEQYRKNHPRNRRWLMFLNPWNRAARFAVAGLAVALLGVGACSTETTTEIEAGQQAHISLRLDTSVPDKAGELDPRVVTDFIAAQPGVDELNVNVREMIDDAGAVTTDLGLVIWGGNLDADALAAALRERFPSLGASDISFEPLTATVTESLFDKLGREVFHVEADGASAEEIRAQILEQLAAQGVEGDAQVEVIDGDGTREIRVMIEQDDAK